MKKVQFIHCADLHLGSPFVGLQNLPERIYQEISQAIERSFSRIVDIAIEKKVDFMIIAGDLYDGEDRNIRAQLYFRKEMERLQAADIPVFIVHGNHDHLGGSWTKLKWPDNVFVFPEQVEWKQWTTANGTVCHLYGFSYPKAHVKESMISHYEKQPGADFHIGILHGHDSRNSEHYQYAPFSTRELLAKGFDYWALGHIHQREILANDPYIIYPGNIQGRNKKETGRKGCFYVTMTEGKTAVDFIETAPIVWMKQEIESPLRNFDDLYQSCVEIKDAMKRKGRHSFVEIRIDKELIASSLDEWVYSDEFLHLLQEGEEGERIFCWIHSLQINETIRTTERVSDHFFKEMDTIIEDLQDLEESLALLYHHPRAKKFLDPLTKQEEREIIEEAKQMLHRYLQGTKGDGHGY